MEKKKFNSNFIILWSTIHQNFNTDFISQFLMFFHDIFFTQYWSLINFMRNKRYVASEIQNSEFVGGQSVACKSK